MLQGTHSEALAFSNHLKMQVSVQSQVLYNLQLVNTTQSEVVFCRDNPYVDISVASLVQQI